MYILGEYYSDLALNKICFWHFITMSQSTKSRWNSGPSTLSSTSKKKKYNCKFQDEWKKSHHWLQSSLLGNDLAFCTLFSSNFSVASGGLYDIKRHSETSLHKKALLLTKPPNCTSLCQQNQLMTKWAKKAVLTYQSNISSCN